MTELAVSGIDMTGHMRLRDYRKKQLKLAQLKKAASYALDRYLNDKPLWKLKAPWLSNKPTGRMK
jgi:hypothetical protein